MSMKYSLKINLSTFVVFQDLRKEVSAALNVPGAHIEITSEDVRVNQMQEEAQKAAKTEKNAQARRRKSKTSLLEVEEGVEIPRRAGITRRGWEEFTRRARVVGSWIARTFTNTMNYLICFKFIHWWSVLCVLLSTLMETFTGMSDSPTSESPLHPTSPPIPKKESSESVWRGREYWESFRSHSSTTGLSMLTDVVLAFLDFYEKPGLTGIMAVTCGFASCVSQLIKNKDIHNGAATVILSVNTAMSAKYESIEEPLQITQEEKKELTKKKWETLITKTIIFIMFTLQKTVIVHLTKSINDYLYYCIGGIYVIGHFVLAVSVWNSKPLIQVRN